MAIKIVSLSNLVAQIYASPRPIETRQEFEQKARQLLGLEQPVVTAILRRVKREIEQAAGYFGVAVKPIRPVAEILQEANIRLSLLHLSYEEMHRELQQSKEALQSLRQQLAERKQVLERLANLDGLTEVHNHRSFQSFLRTELIRSSRNRRPISLLLADIDHFKQFNDCHGHLSGDFILKELCRVIGAILRKYDLLARYGGEEFVVVLPEATVEAAAVVAEKIRLAVAQHDFFDGNHHYRVTLSIGTTTAFPAEAPLGQNEFIEQVDQALYEAKKRGRNQVAAFHSQSRCKWLPL